MVGEINKRKWFCQKPEQASVRWQETVLPTPASTHAELPKTGATTPETPSCSPQAGQPQDPASRTLVSPSGRRSNPRVRTPGSLCFGWLLG